MANRHFGKVADVWKHLPLVAILQREGPEVYAETHAGSAGHAMVNDAERRYGVHGFLTHAAASTLLADTPYRRHLARLMSAGSGAPVIPGSPLLAMLERASSTRYVLCDTDPDSIDDIAAWAATLGLTEQVEVVEADGMSTIRSCMRGVGGHGLVHIDPYEPHAREPGGVSALELAAELADNGVKVMYWYGYDRPDEQAWAYEWLRQTSMSAAWWCGDMMVMTAGGDVRDDGGLGTATTPGTGCGIVCANLAGPTVEACDELGRAMADVYAGVELPEGAAGALAFRAIS